MPSMQMTVLKASLAHEEFKLNLQAGILDLKCVQAEEWLICQKISRRSLFNYCQIKLKLGPMARLNW